MFDRNSLSDSCFIFAEQSNLQKDLWSFSQIPHVCEMSTNHFTVNDKQLCKDKIK